MRIDLYGSAAVSTSDSYVQGTSHPATPSTLPAGQQETDRTTLSPGSRSVATLTRQALAAEGERSKRVQALQQSVSAGDYPLQPDSIAQAILKDRA